MRALDFRTAPPLVAYEPPGGARKAGPPHGEGRLRKTVACENLFGNADQPGHRIGRKAFGRLADEHFKYLVHGAAAIHRTDLGVERIERPQPQYMTRIDRIGI